MSMSIRSRIAPTPSGWLHLGNAFNFLLTEALARRGQGILRLRIDDLDAPRVRPGYIEDVFETLRWLDIVPDEGPADADEQLARFSQQSRLHEYDALLERLAGTGKVFACVCTRADVARRSSDGQYDGACRERSIPLQTPGAAWRFRTEDGDVVHWTDGIAGPQSVSLYRHARDFVVRRADGLPAYHVASLSDDAAYGVNLIVRGADLLHSTAAQLRLAQALHLDPFLQCSFYHHPLLLDGAGGKLSKSAGSMSLQALRESGISGGEIRRQAAEWYGPVR